MCDRCKDLPWKHKILNHTPEWFFKHWPLNRYYVVKHESEEMLREFDLVNDAIVDTRTGLLWKGCERVQ
jgi:hypothetical protein